MTDQQLYQCGIPRMKSMCYEASISLVKKNKNNGNNDNIKIKKSINSSLTKQVMLTNTTSVSVKNMLNMLRVCKSSSAAAVGDKQRLCEKLNCHPGVIHFFFFINVDSQMNSALLERSSNATIEYPCITDGSCVNELEYNLPCQNSVKLTCFHL